MSLQSSGPLKRKLPCPLQSGEARITNLHMVSAGSMDDDIHPASGASMFHRLSMVSSGSKGHGHQHSPPRKPNPQTSTWPSVVTRAIGAVDTAAGPWTQTRPLVAARTTDINMALGGSSTGHQIASASPQPKHNSVPPPSPPLHSKFIHQKVMETAVHHSRYRCILNICKYTHIHVHVNTHIYLYMYAQLHIKWGKI